MAEVIVNLSDKTINQAVRKEVLKLRLQVTRLKASNQKLKSQIRSQNFKFDEAKRIVVVASAIADEFGDEWGDQ